MPDNEFYLSLSRSIDFFLLCSVMINAAVQFLDLIMNNFHERKT